MLSRFSSGEEDPGRLLGVRLDSVSEETVVGENPSCVVHFQIGETLWFDGTLWLGPSPDHRELVTVSCLVPRPWSRF